MAYVRLLDALIKRADAQVLDGLLRFESTSHADLSFPCVAVYKCAVLFSAVTAFEIRLPSIGAVSPAVRTDVGATLLCPKKTLIH